MNARGCDGNRRRSGSRRVGVATAACCDPPRYEQQTSTQRDHDRLRVELLVHGDHAIGSSATRTRGGSGATKAGAFMYTLGPQSRHESSLTTIWPTWGRKMSHFASFTLVSSGRQIIYGAR